VSELGALEGVSEPVVALEGANQPLIALEGVSTRRAPFALANVSLAWGPGIHAIAAGAADGARSLLELTAGAARPLRGRVRVLGGDPRDPEIRKQIAFVGEAVTLPEAMRVDEVLTVAATLRGDTLAPATARLDVLGVGALERRLVRSLSRAEARAVALAEALTSARARVLLIEEPLVGIEPHVGARVVQAMRAKAAQASAIVFSTGSLRDAGAIADDWVALRDGAVTRDETAVSGGPARPSLVLVTTDPASARALVAHLTQEPDVGGIEYTAGGAGEARSFAHAAEVVRLEGHDPIALANAAARAVAAAGVEVVQLRIDPPFAGSRGGMALGGLR
jgi:ABC-2 type transport system ATP-binding protein